ncbi:MAG: hypothetical protein KKI09_07045 [Spirochaetes bacterium]|nr:hypothetical protein [Spirochaetota bacterium]MBU0955166.1 hypothetical protein [Spirochaetota bacterium]
MKKKLLGILILVAIVAFALSFRFLFPSSGGTAGQPDIFGRSTDTVSGLIGSEKANFLENPETKELLRKTGGLQVAYQRAGSIEMIGMDHVGKDFLWPSSQVSLELYKLRGGTGQSTIIFNSPIVIYSWDVVVDALVAGGYAENRNGVYYIVRFRELIEHTLDGTTWNSIGLPQLYGRFSIISTDPNKSNSGAQFAGLLANMLAGEVATEKQIDTVSPQVREFFDSLGLMEHSTGTLFERYITQGVGSYPLIVGYENGLIEFARQNPDIWPKVKDRMRILYPLPTVWSSHPLIALNEKGNRLIEVLTTQKFQELAWKEHGFRSGVPGTLNDPIGLGIAGIARDIEQVMPMPSPVIMEKLLLTIAGN